MGAERNLSKPWIVYSFRPLTSAKSDTIHVGLYSLTRGKEMLVEEYCISPIRVKLLDVIIAVDNEIDV